MNTFNLRILTNGNVYKLVVDFDGNIVARDFDGDYDIYISRKGVRNRINDGRLHKLYDLIRNIICELRVLNNDINMDTCGTLHDLVTYLHTERLKEEQERLKKQERLEEIETKSRIDSIYSEIQAELNCVAPKFINTFRGYKILLEVGTNTNLYLDNVNGVLTDTPNTKDYDVTGTICLKEYSDYDYYDYCSWEVNICGVGFVYTVCKDRVKFQNNAAINYKSIKPIRESSLPLRKLEHRLNNLTDWDNEDYDDIECFYDEY